MELNFMCLYLGSCYFLPFRPHYLLSILISTPSAHPPHLVGHIKFHTHEKKKKKNTYTFYIPGILSSVFLRPNILKQGTRLEVQEPNYETT